MSFIFNNIDKLPFISEEKTELCIFFMSKNVTKVDSTITKDEEKVEFLRK
ncbi:17266_t:CDS:2 [Funneliformis geosporum]|nr:17266_t:CDS:2 [Funneliformis geosporum]